MDWTDLFPDQTPEQVKTKLAEDKQKLTEATQKVEEWKTHSRTWEDRSKENKTRVETLETELSEARKKVDEGGLSAAEAEQLKQRTKDAEDELALTRKLTGMGADAAALMDSKSFMEQVQGLDPESEDYEDKFTDLVGSRTQSSGGPFVARHQLGVRRQVAGGDIPKKGLWEEVHGDKKTNTL